MDFVQNHAFSAVLILFLKKHVFGQGKNPVFLTLGVMTSHDPSSYPCYYPEDIAARDPVDKNNIAEDMRGPKPDIETKGAPEMSGSA